MLSGKRSVKYDAKQEYPFLLRRPEGKQDLIFIHIPKTGGTSISHALRFPLPQPSLKIRKHHTASAIRDFLPPDVWTQAFKFAFVRNPWDRLCSHYRYRKIRNNVNEKIGKAEDFKSWVLANLRGERPGNLQPQINWISDKNRQILVDFVGRFERLEEDFHKICGISGLPITALDHLNASGAQPDYRSEYDVYTRKFTTEFYKDDVRIFNYSF